MRIKKFSRTKTRLFIPLLITDAALAVSGLFLSNMVLWTCGVFPLLVGVFLYSGITKYPPLQLFFQASAPVMADSRLLQKLQKTDGIRSLKIAAKKTACLLEIALSDKLFSLLRGELQTKQQE
ncbi:MAG: hypothetical protein E7330_08390 [Clostridiales bacterium]|nr:hypothetical protein [Clostridiales bacterium]